MQTTASGGGPRRYVVTVLVVIAVAGLTGALGGLLGVRTGLVWVVILPGVYVAASRLAGGGGQVTDPVEPAGGQVLLDAAATWGRVLQVFGPLVGTALLGVGTAALVQRGDGGPVAVALVVAGAAMLGVSLAYPLSWTATYKGHEIRFDNYPCLAERLFIDRALADRGGLGVAMTLRGRIAGGDGAGHVVTAVSRAGLVSFTCRISAGPAAG